jgi:flavin-dependent dehydrogenase
MNIKSVCIVGGGSSGWMTAAALSKLCPHLEITLVESKKVKTVGVGESTLGHINKFLDMLDLKDEDWMAECNATYKNSIQFTNFRDGNGEVFQYPFVQGYDFTDANNGLDTWGELATLYPEEFPPETFSEMYAPVNTFLAKHNKQSNNSDKSLRHYSFKYDTAYHMDAALFGQYLKDKIAIPNGVTHMYKDVHSYVKDSQGNILQILCDDGHNLKADLWIDCTGFQSILLEGWMSSTFIPFDKHLANDKAWACRLPYVDREREMHNVTDCHALDNGWVWNIPLWNRIGTGYVFSSRFISIEGAQQEFREHLAKKHSPELAEAAEMFLVSIKHGHRRRAFVKNVVGIGLSYGFVEPLESTGLLTTHENIIKLIDLLNRRDGYVTRSEQEAYNYAVEYDILGFRDFVSMHYSLSKRTDTPYWRWCTQLNEYHPTQFNDFVPQYNSYTNLLVSIQASNTLNAGMQGGNFIAAGMGIKAVSTPAIVNARYAFTSEIDPSSNGFRPLEDSRKKFHQSKKHIEDYVKTLPSHYQYLKENIYGGTDSYDV